MLIDWLGYSVFYWLVLGFITFQIQKHDLEFAGACTGIMVLVWLGWSVWHFMRGLIENNASKQPPHLRDFPERIPEFRYGWDATGKFNQPARYVHNYKFVNDPAAGMDPKATKYINQPMKEEEEPEIQREREGMRDFIIVAVLFVICSCGGFIWALYSGGSIK